MRVAGLTAYGGFPAISERLARAGEDWPATLARLLYGTDSPHAEPASAPIAPTRASDNPGALFSWLIA